MFVCLNVYVRTYVCVYDMYSIIIHIIMCRYVYIYISYNKTYKLIYICIHIYIKMYNNNNNDIYIFNHNIMITIIITITRITRIMMKYLYTYNILWDPVLITSGWGKGSQCYGKENIRCLEARLISSWAQRCCVSWRTCSWWVM